MSKLPHDQQKAILEAHVGKIDKVLQNVVRDAKRMGDVLDQDAAAKLAAFLHTRVNDMIADLLKGKRSVFSLDAPVVPAGMVIPEAWLVTPGIAVPADKIAHGSMTTVLPPAQLAPRPSVPQPQTDEDDELAAIAELDEPPAPPAPKIAALYEVAPEVPDATKPPKVWRKPTGRLVGTKEPVWVATEEARAAGDEVTEKPDHTGFIKDAGFLEAE
jgi:hypothetical protein